MTLEETVERILREHVPPREVWGEDEIVWGACEAPGCTEYFEPDGVLVTTRDLVAAHQAKLVSEACVRAVWEDAQRDMDTLRELESRQRLGPALRARFAWAKGANAWLGMRLTTPTG